MNTTCLYLSEARSMVPPSTYPRLHSLRSLSLGLLRTSLSEAVSHYCTWMEGIRVIRFSPFRGGVRGALSLEDGHKAHPYIGFLNPFALGGWA